MSKVIETVTPMIKKIVENYNFDLINTDFIKEGSVWFLRVFIDKAGGITLSDCETVSKDLNMELEKYDDVISSNYTLEVSSPGAERPLKSLDDFEQAVGKYIHISLYQPTDKQKIFEGDLKEFDQIKKELKLIYLVKNQSKILTITLDKIGFARLAIKM